MMQVTIKSWAGVETDGVLLSSCGLTLRVALFGSDDAVEFHFQGGNWFRENGEFVEIDFHAVPESDDACTMTADSRPGAAEERSSWLN